MRVGRQRSKSKDLPLGVYPVKGRYYVRPVNADMRQVFTVKFPGKKSAPLGADKDEMRRQWVKLFVTDRPPEKAEAGHCSEIIERFERDVVALMTKGRAKDETERYCRRLTKQFGARRYARNEVEASTGNYARTLDVTQYLRHKDNAERLVAINREVQLFSKMFRLAKNQWGYTEYNPCAGVEYNIEEPRDEYQDDAAFMRVYAKALPVLQCMMDLAQMGGARRGMLIRLTLSDIDEARGVWFTLNKRRKTQKPRRRLVRWDADLRAVIDRALELRAKVRGGQKEILDHASAPLFLNRHGKQFTVSGFNSQWYRARSAAGFKEHEFHFHDIKAKSLSDSPDVIDAMARGDHTEMRTTQRVYRRKPVEVVPLPRVSKS